MLGKSEYNSWMGALQLKDALTEANDRQNGTNNANSKSAASLAGYYGLSPSQRANLQVPLYVDNNKIFASKLINNEKKLPTIPGNTKKGTIVEYRDNEKSEYGIIIDPPIFAKNKGAYIRELKKEEAENLEKKQKHPKIIINKENLKDLSEKRNIFQRVIFSIKSHYKKFREMFLLIYLVIIIGGLIYIISLLFN